MLGLVNGGAAPLLLPAAISSHVMRRWSTCLLVVACLAAAPACLLGGPKNAAATATIGDRCLVGTWTLEKETNTSGYKLNNEPVAVKGAGGATVKFASSGAESGSFDGSDPLIGDYQGHQLSILISGSYEFTIHAGEGKYAEKGTKTQLPTTATVDGQPITYHSSYEPSNGTYECSSTQLTTTTEDGVQTNVWSRA